MKSEGGGYKLYDGWCIKYQKLRNVLQKDSNFEGAACIENFYNSGKQVYENSTTACGKPKFGFREICIFSGIGYVIFQLMLNLIL